MIQKVMDEHPTLRTQLEAHLRTFGGLMAVAQASTPEQADGRALSTASAPKRASPSDDVGPEGRRITRSVSSKLGNGKLTGTK